MSNGSVSNMDVLQQPYTWTSLGLLGKQNWYTCLSSSLVLLIKISTSSFQNPEKSKDWYKTMFKQIHKIPGKRTWSCPLFECLNSFIMFLCWCPSPVCLSICVCMLCHVVLCLSITVLRAYWGKSLPPHLHFPWELWHSDEIKRYPMLVIPLSSALLICSHPGSFQILEAVFNLSYMALWLVQNHTSWRCPKYLKGFYLIFSDVSSMP